MDFLITVIVKYTDIIAFIFLTWFIGWWLWRYIIQPFFEKKRLLKLASPPVKSCLAIINELYKGINAKRISHKACKQHNIKNIGFLYGEIEVLSFAEILSVVKPTAGEIFYDLGCGAGKAVFTAALLYNLRACGVEILAPLYQLCLTRSACLTSMNIPHKKPDIQFIQNDLLQVDISNADIVFINATAFMGDFWQAIVKHLDHLKSGARIILTTQQLSQPKYELLAAKKYLMSWGMNSVNIYKKL